MRKNSNRLEYKILARLYESGTVFCAFDTETTGLQPSKDRIIELGAIVFNKDGIISEFNELINPCMPIPALSTAINNITDEMVLSCPTANQILPDFLNLIQNKVLLGHNINFDIKFLNKELELCAINPVNNKYADTLLLSRFKFPEMENHRLQTLAKNLKINVFQAHRALDDARVCMELFLKCLSDSH